MGGGRVGERERERLKLKHFILQGLYFCSLGLVQNLSNSNN